MSKSPAEECHRWSGRRRLSSCQQFIEEHYIGAILQYLADTVAGLFSYQHESNKTVISLLDDGDDDDDNLILISSSSSAGAAAASLSESSSSSSFLLSKSFTDAGLFSYQHKSNKKVISPLDDDDDDDDDDNHIWYHHHCPQVPPLRRHRCLRLRHIVMMVVVIGVRKMMLMIMIRIWMNVMVVAVHPLTSHESLVKLNVDANVMTKSSQTICVGSMHFSILYRNSVLVMAVQTHPRDFCQFRSQPAATITTFSHSQQVWWGM